MLDDLGATLSAVLRERLPAGTTVRLDPPNESWSGSKATIGLFLHRVLENSSDSVAGLWTEERDIEGRVARRASPERRYDCCYLVTAWADGPDQELGLLGGVLRTVANDALVSAPQLSGSLQEARSPVTLAIGRCGLPSAVPEIWTALGLHPRLSLDLVATAPVTSIADTSLADPPRTIDLGVTGPTVPTRTGARVPRRPAARITEGRHDG